MLVTESAFGPLIRSSLHAHNIQDFIEGVSRKEFLSSQEKQSAVRYEFIMFSRTLKHLPAIFRKHFADIPWKQAIGIGDRLAHIECKVDNRVIWLTIKRDLPLFFKFVEDFLIFRHYLILKNNGFVQRKGQMIKPVGYGYFMAWRSTEDYPWKKIEEFSQKSQLCMKYIKTNLANFTSEY